MDAKVYELINDQINKEFFAGYLYLSIADFYADAGLDGYANFYKIQAEEERDHALIFRKYLLENDMMPKLKAVEAPNKEFKDFGEPLQAAYEHEQYVTGLINNIFAAAKDVNDYRACQFLEWFIEEQMEEEETARDMITKYELFGDDKHSLFELDQQLKGRTYTQTSKLSGE